MPYIITEPQRVAGTKIGFAIYPYQFSFFDRRKEKDCLKLVIVKLKDSPYIEIQEMISQEKFSKEQLNGEVVDRSLKAVLNCNPNYVISREKMETFFSKDRSL